MIYDSKVFMGISFFLAMLEFISDLWSQLPIDKGF